MAQELKPRLCVMTKGETGYGFHLHGEKGKSGQYIRKVEAGSSAEAAELRAGDRVVEVNGENVEKETHHQVVQRIKALENETRLLVVDRETDEYLKSLRLTCTEEMARTGIVLTTPGPTPQPAKRENGLKQPVMLSSEEHKRVPKRTPSQNVKKESHRQMKEHHPRLCHLQRGETGYGFNLHSERSKPGQYIRSVDSGSAAARAGLRPQDRLIEVNGINIEGMKHSEVVAFIKASRSEAKLLVVDLETDEHFRMIGVTPTESHVKGFVAQPITNGSPKPQMGLPAEGRRQASFSSSHSVSSSTQLYNTTINGSSTSESSHTDLQSSPEKEAEAAEEQDRDKDPFIESGLRLSPTAAEAKEKAHAKRAKKRAPHMDWSKKHEIFSNF
ncbi:NHERF family PDZ scaffold protein 2 [Amia ocellicauda]|uniref:NHERF family PDZ scaffold protein 2 n=1 Tax=Amia ocellicauda TaxID=2972642 RepID=UPI00346482E2